MMDADWQSVFEETYSRPPSAVQERVWRSVFGHEYPEGLDPYSYVSRTELGAFVDLLALQPGDTLVDLGCGRGGAGLWVASASRCRLIGIDIAEAALDAARSRAAALGADATFRQGTFEDTGLPEGVADAIMSVDALLFTPDKAAALSELRRIARRGARLALTSWDYRGQPPGRPPQVADHRPLLEPAGWSLVAYDDTTDWRERIQRTGDGLLASVEELAREDGTPIEETRQGILQMNATIELMTRRFLLVATAI